MLSGRITGKQRFVSPRFPKDPRKGPNTMKHLMIALVTLGGVTMPVNAKGLDDAMLKAGAEIILYYAVCTEKPFSPGAVGHLTFIIKELGLTVKTAEPALDAKVQTLIIEWSEPDLPNKHCMDARKNWGPGLLPEGESTQ
jgi:hypothetical protein